MRFENDKDLIREQDAIEIFCGSMGISYEKLSVHDVDYKLTKEDRVAYAEVKGRNRSIDDAYPLPIAARKVLKLIDKKRAAFIIWDCYDGIIWGKVSDIVGEAKVGGRKPRDGAYNDIEFMIYYDKQKNLITIKKDC
jgi:hypothetical protein